MFASPLQSLKLMTRLNPLMWSQPQFVLVHIFAQLYRFFFQFSLLSQRFQSRRACFKLSFYGLNMFSLSVSLVFLFWDYSSWAWLKKVRTCITIRTHGSQPCGHSSLSKHNVLLMFVVLTFLNKYTKTKACFNCNYFSKDVVLFQ